MAAGPVPRQSTPPVTPPHPPRNCRTLTTPPGRTIAADEEEGAREESLDLVIRDSNPRSN
jgi:hypothetical protein